MVEVDPKLFVTCRLCLDVQGHFQIDPSVQQQIKYCFDIDVEPFDRLPQLICKKCENILRDYYTIKKNFTNKQQELKTTLQENVQTKGDRRSSARLDGSDSPNNKVHNYGTRNKKKVKRKRILKRILSSSDDDEEQNISPTLQINENAGSNKCTESCISREENYNKYYVCRICSRSFHPKERFTKHLKEHYILQKKYKNIFKMNCLVVMEKYDDKHNMCNSDKAVVYSADYIIKNNWNPFYSIIYRNKTSKHSKSSKIVLKRNSSDRESIDDDLIPEKCRRLSRSSNETVVINRQSENDDTSQSALSVGGDNVPTVIDCIDLGDSSDNESYGNNEKNSNSIRYKNKRLPDSKYTQHMINICFNRYNKQVEPIDQNICPNTNVNEEFLQHKVLSLGRKIINNKGFNCVGLLRFLEYKGLSVIWKETIILIAGNDAKYAHVATALRRNESTNVNDAKWEQLLKPFKFGSEDISVNLLKKLKTLEHFKSPTVIPVLNEQNSNSVEQLPRIDSVYSETDLEITKTESDNVLLTKLLNKNPVSNPKQLPKKVNGNDNFAKNMRVFSAPNTLSSKNTGKEKSNEINSNTMAVVTTTTSIPILLDKEKDTTGKSGDLVKSLHSSEKPQHSWLKVKPVSELMPDKTISNGAQNTLQMTSVIWPPQNAREQQIRPSQSTQNVIMNNSQNQLQQSHCFIEPQVQLTEIIPLRNQSNNTVSIENVPQSSRTGNSEKDYILLHTVEFPNTKTSSPFHYLKNLLLFHNITLLNAGDTLSGAIALIKLKIHFQQQKCESIILILSLYCSKKKFCIEIINLNSERLNINNLNAEWQWQLLNTFNNEEVVNKCLNVAGKASTEMYQQAKNFFTLLKSINLIG